MKHTAAILLWLAIATTSIAQNNSTTKADEQVSQVALEEPSFPGGLVAWKKHLDKNLNHSLGESCLKIKKGEASVKQTVVLSFKVDEQGKVSDVTVVNSNEVHPLLAAEAVRIITTGPDWVPARQDGKNIVSSKRQTFTWVVSLD